MEIFFIMFLDKFCKKARNARAKALERAGPDAINEIIRRLTNKDTKTSADGRKRKMAEIIEGIDKKRKITKPEEPTGVVDQTVYMRGGIMFKYLTLSRSCDDCNKNWKNEKHIDCTLPNCCMASVHAELDVRQIKLTIGEHKTLNIREKHAKIRDDEAKHWNVGDRAKEGFDIKSMRFFQPQSELMKGHLDKCMEELNKEKGITIETH